MASLLDQVAAAAARLEREGLPPDEARQSAEVLARAALGWSVADWLSHRREPAPAGFPTAFQPLVDRRTQREPVAYILGEREFWGRRFKVTRDVLIPRPETELVIDEVKGSEPFSTVLRVPGSDPLLRKTVEKGSDPLIVVDVGTGSGCIAVTLALELPGVRVIATDMSESALSVARENAERLGAADRIEFRAGHLLAGLPAPVDFIVSNPPYVAETDRPTLSPDVAAFEPATALFGGTDGLDVIRDLVQAAATALAPHGALVMEIGQGQADAVRGLVEATGALAVERIRADLQGIPRVVVARKRPRG